MAKPRRKIDASQIEDLASIGSTLSEMAILLDCSEETLYRRFLKAIKKGIVRRTIFLKRQQFDLAVNGNAAAPRGFWKTCLGQTSEQLQDLERHEKEDLASLSKEELIERLTEVRDSADRTLEGFAANKGAAPAEPRTDPDGKCTHEASQLKRAPCERWSRRGLCETKSTSTPVFKEMICA